ncbi:MAG TPA: ribonuclease D, partial [Propylenella sp.]
LHLHAIKAALEDRLRREGRLALAEACFRFVPVRAELDLLGWDEEDIFAHS